MAEPPKAKGKRQALGRGLSALIPQQEPGAADGGLQELAVDRIDAGTYQPRTHFDTRSLEELAASVKRYGVLQPLVVIPKGDRYELVAGERRLRAAKLAKLPTVPALIRDLDHDQQLEISLIENVQRADLNAVEEARGYLQLMDTFDLTQQEAAGRIGKSRAYLANKIRLLNLPEELQVLLVDGRLSEGHARALLGLKDPARMIEAATDVVEQSLTVRDTEQIARRKRPPRPGAKLDPDWEALERELEAALGTPVQLRRGRRGGSITIRFYDDDQLDAMIRRLRG